MNKKIGFFLFFLGFLLGLAVMRIWDMNQKSPAESRVVFASDDLEDMPADMMDLSKATEVEGDISLAEAEKAQQPLPESQLATMHLPDIKSIVPRTKNADKMEEDILKTTGVPLENIIHKAPSVTQPSTEMPQEKSSISMIAAPAEVLLIKTTDEYKAFKRRARGSYPVADFSKENVLVLESASNLPDKMFEIQKVEEKNGKRFVIYRVNIFGLDKKTNTHSAVLISKQDLPIELKQVL